MRSNVPLSKRSAVWPSRRWDQMSNKYAVRGGDGGRVGRWEQREGSRCTNTRYYGPSLPLETKGPWGHWHAPHHVDIRRLPARLHDTFLVCNQQYVWHRRPRPTLCFDRCTHQRCLPLPMPSQSWVRHKQQGQSRRLVGVATKLRGAKKDVCALHKKSNPEAFAQSPSQHPKPKPKPKPKSKPKPKLKPIPKAEAEAEAKRLQPTHQYSRPELQQGHSHHWPCIRKQIMMFEVSCERTEYRNTSVDAVDFESRRTEKARRRGAIGLRLRLGLGLGL